MLPVSPGESLDKMTPFSRSAKFILCFELTLLCLFSGEDKSLWRCWGSFFSVLDLSSGDFCVCVAGGCCCNHRCGCDEEVVFAAIPLVVCCFDYRMLSDLSLGSHRIGPVASAAFRCVGRHVHCGICVVPCIDDGVVLLLAVLFHVQCSSGPCQQ